jgi:hypothetical protein
LATVPGERNVGEHQMVVVQHRYGALGGKVRGSIGADGGDEAQLLLLDHAPHVGRQNAHGMSLGSERTVLLTAATFGPVSAGWLKCNQCRGPTFL